jgi:hypothetical protein
MHSEWKDALRAEQVLWRSLCNLLYTMVGRERERRQREQERNLHTRHRIHISFQTNTLLGFVIVKAAQIVYCIWIGCLIVIFWTHFLDRMLEAWWDSAFRDGISKFRSAQKCMWANIKIWLSIALGGRPPRALGPRVRKSKPAKCHRVFQCLLCNVSFFIAFPDGPPWAGAMFEDAHLNRM